jgi:cyclic AMP-responsive element-binding protein 3
MDFSQNDLLVFDTAQNVDPSIMVDLPDFETELNGGLPSNITPLDLASFDFPPTNFTATQDVFDDLEVSMGSTHSDAIISGFPSVSSNPDLNDLSKLFDAASAPSPPLHIPSFDEHRETPTTHVLPTASSPADSFSISPAQSPDSAVGRSHKGSDSTQDAYNSDESGSDGSAVGVPDDEFMAIEIAGETIQTTVKTPAQRPFAKRSKQNSPMSFSDEEYRLLIKEGWKYPRTAKLSKEQEKELKKLRRKIKNKISAQDSRIKRRQYTKCLEEKVREQRSMNSGLKTRVTSLEKENNSLLSQLRELQSKLSKLTRSGSATAGTALMLLGVCFSMFAAPQAMSAQPISADAGAGAKAFRSRTLLSTPPTPTTDTAHINIENDDDIVLSLGLGDDLNDSALTLGASLDVDEQRRRKRTHAQANSMTRHSSTASDSEQQLLARVQALASQHNVPATDIMQQMLNKVDEAFADQDTVVTSTVVAANSSGSIESNTVLA